jgi:hypothetical protein
MPRMMSRRRELIPPDVLSRFLREGVLKDKTKAIDQQVPGEAEFS